MSKTYEIYSRGDEKCWLTDTDALTLALSDCTEADMAENLDETTPELLAAYFDFPALLDLATAHGTTADKLPSKLLEALRLAASMPDGILK